MAQDSIKHPNKQLKRRLRCLENKVHEYAQLKIQGKAMDVALVVLNPQTQELYSYRSRPDFPLSDLESMLSGPNARNRLPEDVERMRSCTVTRRVVAKRQARCNTRSLPIPPKITQECGSGREKASRGGQPQFPIPPLLRLQNLDESAPESNSAPDTSNKTYGNLYGL